MSEEVGEVLRRLALEAGWELEGRVADGASRHHELMVRWNQVHNLTRVVESGEVARVHWLDCLLALRALESHAKRADRVIDVGAGAGFPGVCAAVAWPETEVTWLEPARKRVSFLRRVRADLGLTNVDVVEGRLEDAPADPGWDGVLSRATFQPEQLSGLCRIVAPGGWIGALVSEASESSWVALASAAGLSEAVALPYALPGAEKRAVLFARRV